MCGCSGMITIHLFCDCDLVQGPPKALPLQADGLPRYSVGRECDVNRGHGTEYLQPDGTTV